ncbi:MAG: hypothetical protein ACKO2V_12165 [Snowella sp.]
MAVWDEGIFQIIEIYSAIAAILHKFLDDIQFCGDRQWNSTLNDLIGTGSV